MEADRQPLSFVTENYIRFNADKASYLTPLSNLSDSSNVDMAGIKVTKTRSSNNKRSMKNNHSSHDLPLSKRRKQVTTISDSAEVDETKELDLIEQFDKVPRKQRLREAVKRKSKTSDSSSIPRYSFVSTLSGEWVLTAYSKHKDLVRILIEEVTDIFDLNQADLGLSDRGQGGRSPISADVQKWFQLAVSSSQRVLTA